MRIREILLEYKRDITLTKYGDKLETIAQSDRKQKATDIIEVLEQIDPTKNKQYMMWLINQYLTKQFRLEDKSRIKNVLSQFVQVKNKLTEKDINKYTFRQLESAMDNIFNVTLDDDNKDESANTDEVKVLYDGPLGKLAIPLTKEASRILGRGTKWCTAANKDNMFEEYNEEGPLYIWRDKSGEKYQFHFHTIQFMNDKDEPISKEQLNYFRTTNPVTKQLFSKEEQQIVDSGDAYTCVSYSNMLGCRFILGEPIIVTKYPAAIMYMNSYFNNNERFTTFENYMIEHKQYENIIRYSQKLKQRIPELANCILESKISFYIVKYVQDVIKNDWPESEQYIKDIKGMLDYSVAVKHRMKEWEPTIKTSHYAWDTYVKYVGVPLGELKQMRRDEEKDEEN